ncbi:MAG: 23S rRNA (adenine(2503)-C(2))-methyltransferase RlmN [Clostridia bacterium]|nr:23S rRNA (adenine(2503)-C(2))-methyltransferase RlmN [Clostridia bacterium]
MEDKKDIRSLEFCELEDVFSKLGEPKYRAKQVFSELCRGKDINEITTLSKPLRAKLCDMFKCELPTVETRLVSKIDGTRKYLFRFSDGQSAESVFMKYNHGNTVCVSTQAGCRQGCAFCASTKRGLVRNLEPCEILSQIIGIEKDTGERVSGIVLMGTGEPLDNYENVIKFLHIVTHKDGLCIGARHISLSTCGCVDRIYDLAKEDLQITLSISLHAIDNETRSKIMPINKKWNVETLLTATKDYFAATGRRISFEYTLISGVNDSKEDAKAIVDKFSQIFARSMPLHINLIPVNPIEETQFVPGSKTRIFEFQSILEKGGITATVRRTLGPDINASCGQLRNRAQDQDT